MEWLSPISDFFESILPFLDSVPIIRAIIGFILMFFLPGFAWTFIFFKRIKAVERILLSIALSIAFVTLSLLFTNWLLKIDTVGFNAVFIIVLITVIPACIYYINRYFRRKAGISDDIIDSSDEEDEEDILESYD